MDDTNLPMSARALDSSLANVKIPDLIISADSHVTERMASTIASSMPSSIAHSAWILKANRADQRRTMVIITSSTMRALSKPS